MSNQKQFRDFIVDGVYTIHAQGFSEPVTGRIIDIEVTEDENALLVIKKDDDPNPVNIFVKAISGWTINNQAA